MPALLTHRTLDRRSLLRGLGLGTLGLVGAALLGCSDDEGDAEDEARTEATSANEATDYDLGPAVEYSLVEGWARGEQITYYDFGARSPSDGTTVDAAQLWAFITGMNADGTPAFVEDQHNIVDVVPGEDGYSDLWEVNLVTVPEDFEPDSIRSKADLDAANLESTKPGLYVNCPIVPAGSTFENGERLSQGWYEGQRVYYPDFGPNPPTTLPVWVFITGMDAAGEPVRVEGQRNILDSLPGDEDYTAFWTVHFVEVPADYEANSITSAAEIEAAGLPVTQADMVVNCPVVTPA